MPKQGLTIIECLLSIIILAIMLTAGMAFYFNAQTSMRWSVHKRIALEMAGAELEKIKNAGYSNLPDPCPGPAGCVITNPNVAVGALVSLSNTTVVKDVDEPGTPAGTDYKQITTQISWQDAGKSVTQSARLDTYIAP
jgi:prepilin-type N-terminal cleavage/methylation domain-containing protein